MKKGILALAGLTTVLALPVAAIGDAASSAKALRGQAFEISFTLKSFEGEARALKNFRFSKLEAACDDDATVNVRGRLPYIKVNDRNRFSKTLRRDGKTVRVKGRVSNDLNTVRGSIRAQGDFGTALNCDSDRVPWRAG
jgi:hypothetical protein